MRYLRLRRIAVVLVGALGLAACAPPTDPAIGLTAAALNATLSTEVAIARSTATYAADRRQVTQIAAREAVSRARDQQSSIIATLEELDLPRPDVSLITPVQFPTAAVQASPTPDTLSVAGGGITLAAPTVDPNATATFTPAPTLPSTATPTVDPNAPRLDNIVTSTGVDGDDCPVNPTATFSPSTTQIYVVATAYNLGPGGVVASRWLRDGQQVAYYEFAPDFTINGACIWFFVDQTDFAFQIGSTYQIELLSNGVNVRTVTFAIE